MPSEEPGSEAERISRITSTKYGAMAVIQTACKKVSQLVKGDDCVLFMLDE